MIELEHVYKRFDDVVVLKDLSIKVPTGHLWGIFGSNGAGKSTLLNLLAGVYHADQGIVRINGVDLRTDPSQKAMIQLVPERPYTRRGATLQAMVELYRYYFTRWDQQRFNDLRDVFGITLKKPLDQMSQGVQRQAGIMLALSARPDTLILDEVLDHLDPIMQRVILDILLSEMGDRGLSIIMTSHVLSILEAHAHVLTLLHDGALIPAEHLRRTLGGRVKYQLVFAHPQSVNTWAPLQDALHQLRIEGHVITFLAPDDSDRIASMMFPEAPLYITKLRPSLEEHVQEEIVFKNDDRAVEVTEI